MLCLTIICSHDYKLMKRMKLIARSVADIREKELEKKTVYKRITFMVELDEIRSKCYKLQPW